MLARWLEDGRLMEVPSVVSSHGVIGAKYSRNFSMNGVSHILLRRLLCVCVRVRARARVCPSWSTSRLNYSLHDSDINAPYSVQMEKQDCPLPQNQSTVFRCLV
jgi:hypothetical protein